MDILFLVARILFALLFLFSAVGHLTQAAAMTGYAQSRGLPFPKAGVIGSGVVMLLAGLSILLGFYADLGSLALAALMIVTALAMHAFWNDPPEARQNEQIQFLKDISLAGGALAFYFAFAENTAYSIGGSVLF